MDSMFNEIAPVIQRAIEFALERTWIDYLLFLIPMIMPFVKTNTLQSYTVYVVAVTIALVVVRRILSAAGPWGAMRNMPMSQRQQMLLQKQQQQQKPPTTRTSVQ
jgi:hypothetical protein